MDNKLLNCNQKKSFVNFTANISIHVLFLFSILTILFIKIISKLESDTINDELKNVIADLIDDKYNKLNQDQKLLINEGIKYIDFKNIIKLYDSEDVTRRLNNEGVYKSIYVAIASLIVILFIILLVSKKLCNNIPLKYILIENIIIFAGVGVVEYLFFKYIILKYIPVKPSFIMDYMIKKIQSVL
jgi:hypothetical protein